MAINPQSPEPAQHDGHLSDEALARSLGVVSHPASTYTVGPYRYTNIADAIAQARRMIALEDALR